VDTTAKSWTLAAIAIACITAITLGAGHLLIEATAATGIATPDEITRLLARGGIHG
jgi:hypothetical protein